MYINKQTTAKAGFNPNSIKNFINVKTTFKNIFHNLIHIDFTIFCLQMSIQIGNVSNKKNLIRQGQLLYKPSDNQTLGLQRDSAPGLIVTTARADFSYCRRLNKGPLQE